MILTIRNNFRKMSDVGDLNCIFNQARVNRKIIHRVS